MQQPKNWSTATEPSSYDQIYQYVENLLNECSTNINEIENEYYQKTSTAANISLKYASPRQPFSVNTLIAWSRLLNEIRAARSSRDVRNGKSVRDLLNEARQGILLGPISDESLYLIRCIMDRTTDQLYTKIPQLANKIGECMELMERYFLSFYTIENIQDIVQKKKKEKTPINQEITNDDKEAILQNGTTSSLSTHDEYIETAYSYEKSRWTNIYQVNKSLKLLREMSQRTEDTKGIVLSTLSRECQELAIRCDCTSFPYIFALPECYIEARRCIFALQSWLTDDKKYTSYVQGSVRLLDEKYAEAKRNYEIGRAQLSHAEHRVNSFKTQLDKAKQENEINEKKLNELETRLESKEREYLSKRLTCEVYEDQLKKMLEAVDQPNGAENSLSIERFQQEIKQFTKELPKLKSQMDAAQGRIEYFKQRKEEFVAMYKAYENLEAEAQTALEDKVLKENEYNRISDYREILREIYKCRSTNDLPQKIFYSLPVKSKHSVEDDDDILSKAIRLISKQIGRDWSRLYWELPFYPSRGQEEISKDISHIDDKYHRGDVFHDQAIDSLSKWRRFHTRAKINDLIDALRKIHRFDIIQQIERRLIKPKASIDDEREEIDPRKKEIDELNKKLNRLFEKIRTGVITTHDTYVYSTIGLDPLKPPSNSGSRNHRKRVSNWRSVRTNAT